VGIVAPSVRSTNTPISQDNIPRFYLFIALTSFVLWTPIWVVFFERRGLSLSQIGLLETIAFGLLAASEVPTGTVADVQHRRPPAPERGRKLVETADR